MAEDSIKKLTILHSNDLHGDFLPKEVDGKEVGGLPRLGGYVRKVRGEKENPFDYQFELDTHRLALAACGYDVDIKEPMTV